jgi:hypothetical protein
LGLDSYAYLLGQANIVLLPYERENYVRRSSGIFYESLFNSAIPIIPTGTSMSCSVYQTYSTWLERHGNSQESESLVQGKSYIASFHCKMDEMTAFCFSYVGDNGSNLKIIIRDDTFGKQDSHLILNLEPQLANRFAIPINPNFGSISVEISREDGSTFILQEVSLATHSLDASFYGIVFDSKMKIADNIKYVLMNLEKSVVAVEYIKEVLMLSNSYVNAVDVILENTK